MAETKIVAGATIDVLTQSELRSVLKSWQAELTKGAKFVRRSMSGIVAADGTLLIEGGDKGFQPQPGFTWAITRLTVEGLASGQQVQAYANDANPSSLLVPELEMIADPAATASTPSTTVGTDPAVNTEASVTVPAGEVWDLQSFHVALVTDANAANRRVNIRIDNGTSVFATMVAAVDQTATTTVTYSAIAGGTDYAAARDGKLQIGLPAAPMRLGPGYRIRTTTTNIQAGDNYSAPVVSYIRTTAPTRAVFVPGDHGVVLQESDQLVIAGTGLTAAATVVVTAQIKEVPAAMAWSL